jgi:hypothetical protein
MVGVMLWTRNGYAVTAAKIYFAAMLTLFGGVLAIALTAGTSMQPDDATTLGQSVVFSVIWLAYLQFSKRVRLTFANATTAVEPAGLEQTS